MIDVGIIYFDTLLLNGVNGRNNKVDITSAEIWQIQKQDGIILLGVGLSLWEDNVMIVLIITTGQ